MTKPVIIQGYCCTLRGGKNILAPGCFKNGTEADPLLFTFGQRGDKPAGEIIDHHEKYHGLYIKAKVYGGKEALRGYNGLSVSMAITNYKKNHGRIIIQKVHLMRIAIVRDFNRKNVPDAVPCCNFQIIGEVE